jgi:hypothetical protein
VHVTLFEQLALAPLPTLGPVANDVVGCRMHRRSTIRQIWSTLFVRFGFSGFGAAGRIRRREGAFEALLELVVCILVSLLGLLWILGEDVGRCWIKFLCHNLFALFRGANAVQRS